MNVVLLGPPGAGKGTLSGLLKDTLGLFHISTGDILREEMKNNTPLGQEVKCYVDKGDLVPDELVTKLLAKRINLEVNPKVGYILDGFPRTRKQAESLDKILSDINKPLTYVIYLEASLDIIVQRISGRRVAPKSGRVYHTENRPPKQDGICDVSGEKLVQRPDDNEKTIKKRMNIYLESTLPIVDYYETKGVLLKVNGEHHSEDILKELIEKFSA